MLQQGKGIQQGDDSTAAARVECDAESGYLHAAYRREAGIGELSGIVPPFDVIKVYMATVLEASWVKQLVERDAYMSLRP